MSNRLSMLTLFIRIREDARSQKLAATLKDGFEPRVRTALGSFGVRDARITSIPMREDPSRYEAILLCTTYPKDERTYEKFFFDKLPRAFVALAGAALDAPPELLELSPEQIAVLDNQDDSDAAKKTLSPLFDAVARFIESHDLTRFLDPTEEPGEPPLRRARNQFHSLDQAALSASW
jgi:hypothetical protein